MEITKRQKNILKLIVEQYISNATPISSKEINEQFLTDVSSATIRNDMKILEDLNYIEKTHTSSGRVPTTLGYQFYESEISKPEISDNIKIRLKKVFAKRLTSIETIIDESISIINETLCLPSVLTVEQKNELLKRIDLIPLNTNLAITLVVTSTGNVIKNTISFKNDKILNDLSTCIRIFNDRLVDTALNELSTKIESIKPLIQSQVENYEFIMQELLSKIFSYKQKSKSSVYGTKFLTSQPEFQDIDKMNQILNLLEDTNIWSQIAFMQEKTGKTTLIAQGEQIGVNDIAIAATTIKGVDDSKQIAIVGPSRMDYNKIKGILDFIKEELEKKYNE